MAICGLYEAALRKGVTTALSTMKEIIMHAKKSVIYISVKVIAVYSTVLNIRSYIMIIFTFLYFSYPLDFRLRVKE